MAVIFRCFVADYRKTKRLGFRTAHVFIPVCTAFVFLAYYAVSPWDVRIKTEGYFQILGVGLPFLIGLFTVMLAEQESSAASFQIMLSAAKRLPMFYSKLILLVLSSAFSILVASLLFGMGNMYVIKQSVTGMGFYLSATFALVLGNVLITVFHLFLSLRFNKGVSIMIGIAESIVAALMLTGLGEVIWCYVPCAWSSRIITYLLLECIGERAFDMQCVIAAALCVLLTVCAVLLFGVWADHWEGQHTND